MHAIARYSLGLEWFGYRRRVLSREDRNFWQRSCEHGGQPKDNHAQGSRIQSNANSLAWPCPRSAFCFMASWLDDGIGHKSRSTFAPQGVSLAARNRFCSGRRPWPPSVARSHQLGDGCDFGGLGVGSPTAAAVPV